MNSIQNFRPIIAITILVLVSLACGGTVAPPPTLDANQIQTAIMQTIAAQPTNTPEPIMTETLQQSTPNNVCVFCNLECPSSQGELDFCMADPKLIADQTLLENTLRTYCDFKGGDFCKVLVWTDLKYVPSSLPMSDEQVNNEVADYNRNKSTGNDCLKILSAGSAIYQSAGCK